MGPGFAALVLGAGGGWRTAFTASIGSGGAQVFNTENLRMQIKGSDFTATGGSLLRLTLYSHPTNTLVISAATVQQCDSTWSATNPDFSTTPISILCSALNGGSPAGPWTLTAGGGPWVTDTISLGITAGIVTNGLGIAFKFNNGSNMQLANGTTGTGANVGYRSAADETGTADVSSYTSSTDNYKQIVVGKVEVFV